jgi:hypothetical protein
MSMTLKKKGLALAVAGALGLGVAPAFAMVTGVSGEGALVPLMLNDNLNDGPGATNTYVELRVPQTIGLDMVLNVYTTPHVAPGGAPVAQASSDFRIHWVIYDWQSRVVSSGYCPVSPGDTVLWSTDNQLYQAQAAAQALPPTGTPTPMACGPASNLSARVGYVVFQTVAGAKGLTADFAFTGNAWIIDQNIAQNTPALMSVPVMPLADGADPAQVIPNQGQKCTSTQVTLTNNIINPGTQPHQVTDPCQVAPIAAGVRMNNGDGINAYYVDVSGAVQQTLSVPLGYSLHAFWFDRNNAARSAYTWIWDEHEQYCNQYVDLPWEVNVWVYNMENSPIPANTPAGWGNLGPSPAPLQMTDLVKAVTSAGPATVSAPYCAPPYMAQTFLGVAEYQILEEGDTPAWAGQGPSSAAVMFTAQESMVSNDAWTYSPMAARGFLF